MPDWIRRLGIAGLLCLPSARGVCQGPDEQIPAHNPGVAADPSSSLVHYRLAEAYFQQKNYQSAANEFRKALNGDLEPRWTQMSHFRLGNIFDLAGQHDRALGEYAKAQETDDRRPLLNGTPLEPGQVISLSAAPPPLPLVYPIKKTDPEYNEEPRVAELEGSVILSGEIDEEGFARNLKVVQPLGLGLDENAIEAVKQWHFRPVLNQSQQARPTTQIDVDFRLPTHQSRWHLIQVQFDTPPGTVRPVFVNAPYPIGAGLGPEAMEEGRLVIAMGRFATVKLTFQVDERGIPVQLQVPSTSDPVWGSEATAVVGQWRFAPAMKNGIAVPAPCTVELVWGQKELTGDLARQLHDVLAAR